MKRNKRILKRKEQGITLIALVITIIVLLILAGVSIAMLTGDNGILTQATNAKEKTSKAEEEEKVNMAVLGSSIADNGYSEILDEASFRQELTNQFGNNGYDLVVNGDGSFIITVKESQRKYYINDDKTIINSDNIVEINNVEELMFFRDDVNNGNSYEGKAVLLTSDITLSGEWEPIGYYDQKTENEQYPDTVNNKPFRGIFDGSNCTINGINITTNKSYQGFFSFVVDGTIRNIVIGEENNISGNSRIGGVVGYLYGFEGNVSNCINYSNVNCVSGGGIVGGIAGQHTISNCKNYGNIVGAGGIVGSSNGISDWPEEFKSYYNKIINCGNYGSVTNARSNFCGGVTGYFKGEILNCCNKGEIIGKQQYNTGGIAGNVNGVVENCYNSGNITGVYSVGGILGTSSSIIETRVVNSYSSGEKNGDGGNIIGHVYPEVKSEIVNCYTKDDTFTASNLGDAFKEDTGENGGYPMLYWE